MDYRLMPNEVVLRHEDAAWHGKASGELVITNFNIIFIEQTVFGKTKDILYYPINQIKKYNGKPHVACIKHEGEPALEVSMLTGTEIFEFDFGKKGIDKLVALITGSESNLEIDFDDDYEDEDTLVGVFKELGRELNSVIGIPTKKRKKESVSKPKEKINIKCKCCSAMLSGFQGETVRCEYCDSEQIL